MSLTAAANNALSGLKMASMTTKLISDNIANALTPGYGVRSIMLTSDHNQSGVRILDVARHSDPVLLANRRMADGQAASTSLAQSFLSQVQGYVGLPDAGDSLSARMAQFTTDLLNAASAPESEIRLDAAVQSAADLVTTINQAAAGVQTLRGQADESIANQVDRMNELLVEIDDLNAVIAKTEISGSSTAPLLDQRQVLIDELAKMVPLREVPKENGRVALYTNGGAIILDQEPVEFGFTGASAMSASMSLAGGPLSGLTMNGKLMSTDPESSPFRGGTLIAEFEIRDVTAVEMQARLDGFAVDLIERFEDSGLDGTRAAGDPGLFTDNGSTLDLLNTTGLAQRLSLNSAVDGNSWRLRDGLGALAEGDVGDASLLKDLTSALEAGRAAPSGVGTGNYTAMELAGYVTSLVSSDYALAERELTYAAAQQAEMRAMEEAQGVDTDAELQALMIIEQIYAANAQVMETIDNMLDELMRI